jgi:hypothetical protein
MSGRHCYAAKVISPSLELAEYAKTGHLSSLTTPPTTTSESASSTPQSTPTRRSSLSPIRLTPPMARLNFTSDKSPALDRVVHKFGEVYFINDEINTLLMAVPLKKLDSGPPLPSPSSLTTSGLVLLALPMNRVDATIDSEDDKLVKFLVRSSIPLAAMVRVSAETSSSSSSAYADGPKMNNILPPRTAAALYQMEIGFESNKFCEAAVKYVETCRWAFSFPRSPVASHPRWQIASQSRPSGVASVDAPEVDRNQNQ